MFTYHHQPTGSFKLYTNWFWICMSLQTRGIHHANQNQMFAQLSIIIPEKTL